MKSIELFAGIGGISLAAEWAGIETVAFCEIDDYAGKVLQKNWPNVPIFKDVKKLNRKALEESGAIEPNGTVELISGGFPCQPYSVAGERKGKEDDRDLWPEMYRIIEEIRPTWVVGENVANFVSMELDRTLTDLESINYSTRAFVIPASSVGAPHRRDRVFIVAHANSEGWEGFLESHAKPVPISREEGFSRLRFDIDYDLGLPDIPENIRVDDGVPHRMDRARCLGNAVVPQQIYPIFEAIATIEEGS